LSPRWRSGDLCADVWTRLRAELPLAAYVHLQGWGEPLLHPRIADMVRDVRRAGRRVGITTNGDLLGDAAPWLVAERADLVTISIAGDRGTHEKLRDGSSFEQLLANVGHLARLRRRKRRRPRIQISYLLTLSNAERLPAAVRESARVGADELFVIHLEARPSRQLYELAALGARGAPAAVRAAVEEAAEAAREVGLGFRAPPLVPDEVLTCALDPSRFAFVGWDGRVAPCVHLLLPLRDAIPRWTEQGPVDVEPVVLGQLAERTLEEILTGGSRRRFLAPFEARRAIERRFLAGVIGSWGSDAAERLEHADEARSRALRANPFPRSCAGCPKAAGW
jgi:MoaA/NifB/PqqE/SkfB family radical SAM enzyme